MQKTLSYDSPAETAFMELVCSGLRGTTPDEKVFAALSGDDWEQIYTMARRQTVCGICYNAYCKLPGSLLPPGTLLPRWVARVNAIETANRAMSSALAVLVDNLRCLGLHPVVQKGLSVAKFYNNPELRECGDIDLWLPESEMASAIAFARKTDTRIQSHPDGSISFLFQGFVVELHRRLINISSPVLSRRMEAFAVAGCRGYAGCADPIPSPPALLELLLVNVHIMRHVFGTGIGLRHLCDYMCASYSLHGQYDSEEFKVVCSMLGISKWTALLNDFLVRHLGADITMLPPSGLKSANTIPTGTLLNIIKEGGNFGHHIKNSDHKPSPVAGSKLHTLGMFLKRSRFAASVAPSEAFWNFFRLIIGQVH